MLIEKIDNNQIVAIWLSEPTAKRGRKEYDLSEELKKVGYPLLDEVPELIRQKMKGNGNILCFSARTPRAAKARGAADALKAKLDTLGVSCPRSW